MQNTDERRQDRNKSQSKCDEVAERVQAPRCRRDAAPKKAQKAGRGARHRRQRRKEGRERVRRVGRDGAVGRELAEGQEEPLDGPEGLVEEGGDRVGAGNAWDGERDWGRDWGGPGKLAGEPGEGVEEGGEVAVEVAERAHVDAGGDDTQIGNGDDGDRVAPLRRDEVAGDGAPEAERVRGCGRGGVSRCPVRICSPAVGGRRTSGGDRGMQGGYGDLALAEDYIPVRKRVRRRFSVSENERGAPEALTPV